MIMGHGCHDCGSPNSCECEPETPKKCTHCGLYKCDSYCSTWVEDEPMLKDDVKEWAIKDEAMGEWWNPGNETWGTATIWSTSYQNAAWYIANHSKVKPRLTARIVPTPPREMTDIECWEWLGKASDRQHDVTAIVLWNDDGPQMWAACRAQYGACSKPMGLGATPCDAIRAA